MKGVCLLLLLLLLVIWDECIKLSSLPYPSSSSFSRRGGGGAEKAEGIGFLSISEEGEEGRPGIRQCFSECADHIHFFYFWTKRQMCFLLALYVESLPLPPPPPPQKRERRGKERETSFESCQLPPTRSPRHTTTSSLLPNTSIAKREEDQSSPPPTHPSRDRRPPRPTDPRTTVSPPSRHTYGMNGTQGKGGELLGKCGSVWRRRRHIHSILKSLYLF